MKNTILATTTNTVEGAEIVKYIELISTNVVIGTHFFSDFGASFTDLFGGYSNTYQNKLQGIYKIALDKLKQQAATIGANAIIGLNIDFDEISGKGKSMFMISALGMAVSLNYTEKNKSLNTGNNTLSIIESEDLERELTKIQIKRALLSNILPDSVQWMYLLNNPVDDIIGNLLDAYLEISHLDKTQLDNKDELLVTNISTYLSISNKDTVVNALYSRISTKFEAVFALIEAQKLFSPKHIQELIKENKLDEAVSCLPTQKVFYTSEDLAEMKQIITQLNSFPDKGKIDTVKGVLSKAKEKYICQNGHASDIDDEFCIYYECGKNIKGLTRHQFGLIDDYKEKVETLSLLLSK